MTKIDLGCGVLKQEGWFGVDIRPLNGVDCVMDLGTDKLPFMDGTVDEIKAHHLLEHLRPDQLFHCMAECWRVLKPMGILDIVVPLANSPADLVHPDHIIRFVPDTFSFFQTPADGVDAYGYLGDKFWHQRLMEPLMFQLIHTQMSPNKIGSEFYKEVIPYGSKKE